MAIKNSERVPRPAVAPNNVRVAIEPNRRSATEPNRRSATEPNRGSATELVDEVDRRILAHLAADARIANNALAQAVGIAPSTCLGRVRALRESGVIRGYHADIDPAAVGRPLQAMIAVRLQAHARGHMTEFVAKVAQLPEVLNVFFLGGADDFLVHIAAAGTETLRHFVVVNLSGNPDVALTETNLIFEHVRAGIVH
jgi:DNA-binding Lrp family transcriptional regulator